MLLSNQITAETLAWKQGMANWESLTCDTFKLLGVDGQSTSKSGRYHHRVEILRKRIKYQGRRKKV